MALPATVDVVERCRVAPPPDSLTTTTSLPLTYLDLTWFMVPTMRRVFFYEFHHSKDYFFNTLLPNLKHSLSVTLHHFFPLAGNLTWPPHSAKPEILYRKGDAVILIIAESTYNFHNLSGNHARKADEFHQLVPSFGPLTPGDRLVPLMCLQVTLFPDKGICIGITFNHVAADGRSINHFIQSWASVCRLQGDDASLLSALPVYDRTNLTDHHEKENDVLKAMELLNISKQAFNTSISPSVPSDRIRRTFVMRPSDVTKLRAWVSARAASEVGFSSFVLTCAYVWVCLIKVWRGHGSDNHREVFSFPVDFRDRLIPPLPKTYFGNCLGFSLVTSTTNDMVQENGIALAAEMIVQAIQYTLDDLWRSFEMLYSEPAFFSINTDDSDGDASVLEKHGATLESECVVTVAGSPRLGVYGTDFGWGKPRKSEVVSIDGRGSISISECPDEQGAIEIGLVGTNKDMDDFASLYATNLSSM